MYLNLFHNGKKYIYETGNKLNIGHLKELSENILKSNKNIMHIVYDNPSTYHKYINPNDNTYLRDLIPKGQKTAKFSIKLQKGNSTSNLKLFQQNKNSMEFNKSLDNMSKKFFGNFSYMYTASKKFNAMIMYKYNELLLEIRELIGRIKAIYEEIYKIYEKSNINYTNDMSKNNKNDITNKMKLITEYEFQIVKFIEKEKNFYSKLNYDAKQCLVEQNGKINIANKAMKEFYKSMFTDNNKDFKFNFDEKNYISNIIENNIKNVDNNTNNKNKEQNNIVNKNNLSLGDELFQDKILKMKAKRNLKSLSTFNLNSNNNNNDSNNNINNNFSYSNFNNQRYSNSNFNLNNNQFNENSNQFIPNINSNNINNNNNNINDNNINSNNMNNNYNNININNNTNNNINKPIQRNSNNSIGRMRSNSKLLISTEVGPDGVQRGRISLFFNNRNSKRNSEIKDDINNIKTDKKNTEDENRKSKFDLIKNKFSIRNSKFGLPLFKSKEEIKKNLNGLSPEDKEKDTKNNNLNDPNKISTKNTSTNMNKELNGENKDNQDNKDNQENKDNIINPKNPSHGTDNEDKSDSTEFLKNKNSQLASNNTIKNNLDINNENDKDKTDENKDSNNNQENNKDNKDNTDKNKIPELHLDTNSNEENDENTNKKKKKEKKTRKKRKSTSDDEDNSSENDTEKKKKKSLRKKTNNKNNSINEDSKESQRSKKSSEDLFDLHLLKNLSVDKDNPYKKDNRPTYHKQKVKENELIKPEIPESDDSEEEKKKLALFKKKKKNHIKNKYDFLI